MYTARLARKQELRVPRGGAGHIGSAEQVTTERLDLQRKVAKSAGDDADGMQDVLVRLFVWEWCTQRLSITNQSPMCNTYASAQAAVSAALPEIAVRFLVGDVPQLVPPIPECAMCMQGHK